MNEPLHYVYRMLATVVLAPVVAMAAPPVARQLSDGPGGATCRHYSVAGKLGWQRHLGDWADAKGVPFGEASFASAAVGPTGGDQPVSFDVTSLVRDWVAAKLPNTGMLLRTTTGKGIVVFRSRESTDDGGQPVLEIEWGDGTRQKLPPVADTFLDCSTHYSLGEKTTIRVGPDQTGLLVFDVPTNPGKKLERATLVLHPVKHYSGQSRIGVFRTVPAWAVAMPSTENGIAARYSDDKGIERDPDVIFATGFEQPGWLSAWQQLTKAAGTTVLEDRENDFVPLDGKALKATLKKGINNALNLQYRFARQAGSEPEEVFFRYYMRLGNDWSPDVEGGKLPGLAGTYGKGGWGMRKADGTNGWSIRGGFSKRPKARDSSGRLTPIGSYVYHADMRDHSGEYWGWNMGPGGLLENNKWYSIEQYLKLNTPGQRDGKYRAWIDGRLVYAKTGLRFRDVDTIKIEAVWMNVYHGGTTPSPRDMSLYIDNVVVARGYIGPTKP